jgi:penicillin amidase
VIEPVEQKNIQPVSFFWTFNKFPSKALQVAYGIDHSKSINEFRSAISLLEAPGLNFTYADKDGNIAWWAAARLMDRPTHVEPKMILDGSSGKDEIIGWFPFSKNPKSENPSSGFVYSANNQPDSAHGIMHPGYYYPGARGKRIMKLLSENDRWDQSGFQEMMLDDLSPTFPEIARMICGLVDGNLTPVEKEALDQLIQWNGSHNLSDVGPTIYYRLVYHLQKNVFEDELGYEPFKVYLTTLVARRSLPYLVDNDSTAWWDNIHTKQVETRNGIVNQSFKNAVKDLVDSLGEEPGMWTWDQAHLIEHVHAIGRKKPFDLLFNVGPFPITGGDEVINKMDFDKTETIHRVKTGPAMRIIIDLADMHNSVSVLPTGQSGHLMSPHYKDQTELYLNGKFRPQHMDKQKIVSKQSRLLLLKPGQL